jgi:hypothetical protein
MARDQIKPAKAPSKAPGKPLGRIVLAACALPGVLSVLPAAAEEAPEQAVVAFKLSGYRDAQSGSGNTTANGSAVNNHSTAQSVNSAAGHATISGASGGGGGGGLGGGGEGFSLNLLNRIHVTTPSIYTMLPLGRLWSLEGSATLDQVSGASPAYYTDQAGFANFKDTRKAADAKLTRYFERQVVALGLSTSTESDYVSNALSAEGRFATDDQNTTFNVGLGLTRDKINPNNHVVSNAHKDTNEVQFGVTQALSARDLVQLGWTHSAESGYLNDPYKKWDNRPDTRNANVLQLRWNHWLGGSALKTGYRWYSDSFGIRSHTVDLALAIPVGERSSVFTPELRWYSQGAANFYVPNNRLEANYPTPPNTSGFTTLDQRMAAYGALTVGAKLEWPVDQGWNADLKFDLYRQQAGLRLIGSGSGGLAPLTGMIWQLGLKHTF